MSTDARTIPTTEELTKAIQESLNPADIRAHVQAALAKQDGEAATAAAQVEAEKAVVAEDAVVVETPLTFSRVEVIGGREFTFEGASEAELDHAVLNAYKIAFAVQPTEATPVVPVVDPAIAAQAAADEAAAKIELELRFKRGEITAADYIEQSGAMSEYLAKQGVPVESLKAVIEQNEATKDEQSWAAATEEFRNGSAGSDWPGGNKNLQLLGRELVTLNLVDAKDKVAALAQAFQSMKSSGIVFPYEPPADAAAVVTPAAVVAAVATPVVPAAVVAPVVPVRVAATSSSLFGQSSGVSGGAAAPATPTKTDAEKAAADLAANASPQEIMAAWKAQQIASGKHPDAALYETYNRKQA